MKLNLKFDDDVHVHSSAITPHPIAFPDRSRSSTVARVLLFHCPTYLFQQERDSFLVTMADAQTARLCAQIINSHFGPLTAVSRAPSMPPRSPLNSRRLNLHRKSPMFSSPVAGCPSPKLYARQDCARALCAPPASSCCNTMYCGTRWTPSTARSSKSATRSACYVYDLDARYGRRGSCLGRRCVLIIRDGCATLADARLMQGSDIVQLVLDHGKLRPPQIIEQLSLSSPKGAYTSHCRVARTYSVLTSHPPTQKPPSTAKPSTNSLPSPTLSPQHQNDTSPRATKRSSTSLRRKRRSRASRPRRSSERRRKRRSRG